MTKKKTDWYLGIFPGTTGNFKEQIILADDKQTLFRDHFRDIVEPDDVIRVIRKGIEITDTIPSRLNTDMGAVVNNIKVWNFLAEKGIQIYTNSTVNKHIAILSLDWMEGVKNSVHFHMWANKSKLYMMVMNGEDIKSHSIVLPVKDIYREITDFLEGYFSNTTEMTEALVCLTPGRVDERQIKPVLEKFGIKYHKYLNHPEFEQFLKGIEGNVSYGYNKAALELASEMIECHLSVENQE